MGVQSMEELEDSINVMAMMVETLGLLTIMNQMAITAMIWMTKCDNRSCNTAALSYFTFIFSFGEHPVDVQILLNTL